MENIITLIENGYSEKEAKIVAEKLSLLTGAFKEAATVWLNTTEETEISSHGYSTKSLMKRHPKMTYPAALLTIDWLEREPEKAKSAIEKGIR